MQQDPVEKDTFGIVTEPSKSALCFLCEFLPMRAHGFLKVPRGAQSSIFVQWSDEYN